MQGWVGGCVQARKGVQGEKRCWIRQLLCSASCSTDCRRGTPLECLYTESMCVCMKGGDERVDKLSDQRAVKTSLG